MPLVAGVDTSTQATKVVVVDADTGAAVAVGRAAHVVTGLGGARETDPEVWWQALRDALTETGKASEIAAVSVAGQQHGLVVLDGSGQAIRPAKLWNDTQSAEDASRLVEAFGGPSWWAERIGLVPVASFTAVPDEGCAPLDVQFTDTSTGNPTEWLWDFGDGGTSTEQNPLYTYVDPGTFVVTLTATNAQDSDTVTGTITVLESPAARFTWPAPVYVGDAVQFTDTSSGTPVSWLWEISDGYSYSVQNPLHTFYTAGDFLVTLTVTNSLGCADMVEQTVTVHELYRLYLPIVIKN